MNAIAPLRPNEAQLWFFDLHAPAPTIAALSGTLDAEETARAARFRFEHDRKAFIVAHGKLREILGACLDQAPAALRLEQAVGEKPVLAEAHGLHFSLSHSGSIGMVGLAQVEIGVDVEVLRPLGDRDEIVRRYFAPAEVRELLALAEIARHQAFFACWTRKEAYVKAIGLGLATPLDGFVVSIDDPARLRSVDGQADEAAHWSLWSGRIGDLACAAAATRDREMAYSVLDRRTDALTAIVASGA